MLVTCTLQAQSYIWFDSDKNNRWADSILTTLTLEEKVGQLLMPRGNVSGKPHDVEKLKMWVKDYKIGGIVFCRPSFCTGPHFQ